MKNINKTLKNRWFKFFKRINGQGNSNKIFNEIIKRYSEPHRFYHTLNHINDCLKEFDKVKDLCKNPNEVEFAIWFHDIIYNSGEKNNEEKSADFAYKLAKNIKLLDKFAKDIKQLILATKHNSTPKKNDARFIVDIDLSSFAKPWKILKEDNKKIKKEYSFIKNKKFKIGRSVLLESFSIRSNIFLTDYFKEKYERKARENIKRFLKELT